VNSEAAPGSRLGRSCPAAIEPITPTATLVTKSASTRPLTERNPARGLSASRRAAIRAAGRWARRATRREPAIVSHGPATIRPIMTTKMPGRKARICPPEVCGRRPTK
jgi:hypothetical protein